jgi:hypothetical protein
MIFIAEMANNIAESSCKTPRPRRGNLMATMPI